MTRGKVTREFRQQLLDAVPILATNKKYLAFASYLLFPSWINDNRKIIVSQGTIYDTLGGRGHHAAYKMVEQFSRDVWPVELSTWKHNDLTLSPNSCRLVTNEPIPKNILELRKVELRRKATDKMVYCDTGTTYSTKSAKAERDELEQRADNMEVLANRNCVEAWNVLNYLNGVSPNRFTKVLAHLDDAMTVAAAHPYSAQELNLLRLIQCQCKPYYKTVERSIRIYSLNASILRLATPVREVLTRDWIKADLVYAQLAICSAVWNGGIPFVKEYLANRTKDSKSFWYELCEHMRIDESPENKKILKAGLYAICFGRTSKNSKIYFLEALPFVKDSYSKFVSHPVIKALLDARTKELELLKSRRYGIDAFGNKIEAVPDESGYLNYRSVLALVAQSYELKILYPVFELSKSITDKNGFEIVLFLHDGFCFCVDRHNQKDYWINKITETVAENCKILGIPTRLEIGE